MVVLLMSRMEYVYSKHNIIVCVSGGYGVATGGPFAWGLCYNKELSPSQKYCDESYKYTYPCSPGADYYGRGAIPIYWYVYVGFCSSVCVCHACCFV